MEPPAGGVHPGDADLAELAALKERMSDAVRQFVAGGISAESLAEIERGLAPLISDAERRSGLPLQQSVAPSVVHPPTGARFPEVMVKLTPDARPGLIRTWVWRALQEAGHPAEADLFKQQTDEHLNDVQTLVSVAKRWVTVADPHRVVTKLATTARIGPARSPDANDARSAMTLDSPARRKRRPMLAVVLFGGLVAVSALVLLLRTRTVPATPSPETTVGRTVVDSYCKDDYTAWQVLVWSDGSTSTRLNYSAC